MGFQKNNGHFARSSTYNCIRTKCFDHPDIPNNASERQNAQVRAETLITKHLEHALSWADRCFSWNW